MQLLMADNKGSLQLQEVREFFDRTARLGVALSIYAIIAVRNLPAGSTKWTDGGPILDEMLQLMDQIMSRISTNVKR